MYTFYNTSRQLLEHGVYHVRSNGEIVKRLSEEDAVYVKKNTSLVGENAFYFYIIEYEMGDCIKIKNFLGKDWTMTLQSVANDLNALTIFINTMCKALKRQNKPFPEKFSEILKEAVPARFNAMKHGSYIGGRTSYFSDYSWIVDYVGKTLNDYVSQSDIDAYASEMIKLYEFTAVEMLLNEKGVKISEENIVAFEKAKEEVKQTIEKVKEKIKNRCFASVNYTRHVNYPTITIYLEDTPCGIVRAYISAANNYYDSPIEINLFIGKDLFCPNTKIDISNECKEFIDLLKKEIYEDGYRPE